MAGRGFFPTGQLAGVGAPHHSAGESEAGAAHCPCLSGKAPEWSSRSWFGAGKKNGFRGRQGPTCHVNCRAFGQTMSRGGNHVKGGADSRANVEED